MTSLQLEFTALDVEKILFVAVDMSLTEILRGILSQEANVNAKNEHGNTLLHAAILKRQQGIVRLLIEFGADVNAKNSKGESPLHIVKDDDLDITRLLISAGADVNALNFCGDTSLHLAIRKRNEELTKLFIDAGADINLWNNDGRTVFSLFLEDFNFYECYETFTGENYLNTTVALMKLLIMAGADVNTVDGSYESYWTALHLATKIKNIKLIQLLVVKGADVNAKDQNGWTPLHYAARNISLDDLTIVEVLLSANADPNARSVNGTTPLCILVNHHTNKNSKLSFKILRLLSKYGADFSARNDHGRAPIHTAVNFSNLEMVKALVIVGGVDVNTQYDGKNSAVTKKETILHRSCANVDLPTVKFLLENGANINAVDCDNQSPFECTLRFMHSYKLYNIEDFDEESDGDDDGDFECNLKEWYKLVQLLRLLLKWKPDINAIAAKGFNILSQDRTSRNKRAMFVAIVDHLAKLHVMKIPIHDKILVSLSAFENIFKQRVDELQLACVTKLHPNSHLTNFNLLMDDDKKLRQYVGNSEVFGSFLNDLRSTFMDKFPIYGTVICERVCKALRRRVTWNKATKEMSDILPINVDPCHQVVIKILNYLSFDELENFVS